MRREVTNRIRFILEELLPPLLKDSVFYRWLAELVWGSHIRELADFRRRAPFLTAEEYACLYKRHPRVHTGSDNSQACINRILVDVVGSSVCDIGCGTGYLLGQLQVRFQAKAIFCVGVDLIPPANDPASAIQVVASKVETLPFADRSFDTVICTHVLEHILDFRKGLAELRRIARRRLIIVVPRERESRYTFNPHFHFFPYVESFLRHAIPIPAGYVCEDIDRDIYYCEDLEHLPS